MAIRGMRYLQTHKGPLPEEGIRKTATQEQTVMAHPSVASATSERSRGNIEIYLVDKQSFNKIAIDVSLLELTIPTEWIEIDQPLYRKFTYNQEERATDTMKTVKDFLSPDMSESEKSLVESLAWPLSNQRLDLLASVMKENPTRGPVYFLATFTKKCRQVLFKALYEEGRTYMLTREYVDWRMNACIYSHAFEGPLPEWASKEPPAERGNIHNVDTLYFDYIMAEYEAKKAEEGRLAAEKRKAEDAELAAEEKEAKRSRLAAEDTEAT
ncbi:hypothetical protein PG993_008013 [Apiospora rasikravindrae]|uniref:Uncharacterized protein n=1 Tax=Apiospora rasikravindrae TaxID=990691 RepID=A0ABR1SZ40_9PEZI